jgi:AmmeMemoRadiSam system protein A
MKKSLSKEQGCRLLHLVRETIEQRLGLAPKASNCDLNDAEFQHPRGTFVTLKKRGNLRGCIGNLEPSGSLVESLRRNGMSAAIDDHRFSPVSAEEFSGVEVEISVLNQPEQLQFRNSSELIEQIRPGIDGVILQIGKARATFLPQVWEQLPEPETFLNHLCQKAGLQPSAWQNNEPEVFVYQVQSFKEERA